MADIADNLQKYRLRKRRKEKLKQLKESIADFMMWGVKDRTENAQVTLEIEAEESKNVSINEISSNDLTNEAYITEEIVTESEVSGPAESKSFIIATRIVYFLFWITLYVIAIELQFGLVFLMVSALLGIYLNTRTGPKKLNEISAYSVFNKNCESIDGTLTAEQFEREIKFGASSVK